MPFQFNPSNFNASAMVENPEYAPIPVGDYRVRIVSAEWYTSKSSGKESIEVKLAVSGQKGYLWHYIGVSFTNEEERRKVDQRIGSFLTNLNIPLQVGTNLGEWIGKTGGVHVKHDTYNGKTSAKVAYFLFRDKVDALPSWVEPSGSNQQSGYSATPQSYRQNNGFNPNEPVTMGFPSDPPPAQIREEVLDIPF